MSEYDPGQEAYERIVAPTSLSFERLRLALVEQLPAIEPDWWARVQDATQAGSVDRLLLLQAEANHRLHHRKRATQSAVLTLLFDLLQLIATD